MSKSLVFISFLACSLSINKAWSSKRPNERPHKVNIALVNVMLEPGSDATVPHGDFFRRGVQLAFTRYSNELKIRGIEISFSNFDYKNAGLDVVRAAEEAVQSNAQLAIGYNYSDHVFLAEPVHTKAHLPLITPYGTATRIGKLSDYVFQTALNNKEQGRILSELIREQVRAGTVAIVVAKDCAYCMDLTSSLIEFLRWPKTQLLELPVLKDQSDLSSIVFKILQEKERIKAVVVPNHEMTSARIVSRLVSSGIKVPFFGGDGWSDYGFRVFNESVKGSVTAFSVTHWDNLVPTPNTTRFIAEFEKQWGVTPFGSAAMAYDAGVFVVNALLNCKAFDRDSITSCLARVRTVDGAAETFSTGTGSHSVKKGAVVMRRSGNKSFQLEKYVKGSRL